MTAPTTDPITDPITAPATDPVRWTRVDSPVGPLLLTADASGALTSLSVPGQKGGRTVQDAWRYDPGPFREAERQLAAYFAGELKEFTLPLRTAGTAFRKRVWAALDSVPYGATTTYGEIAARVGASRAAVRAVGGAIGANPLLIVRPCHRVIGADGSLTGYAGGLDRKVHLLTHEGALAAGFQSPSVRRSVP
ncbi:methylated-DNA--[protein]-cysteine S-methyltransferase [Streptomyces sp. DH24]|uniref:methylated-DNA--[protein]-cysteine S-methyltransferase n=1 Tax=Streptomyces sp. DH24 TaxID=3040123 RepID=UPI002442F074|nr:methylated-DNA--[protein]-cysteine S-methyltransferase [Streptomyces sp. DH24]MDG9717780.1 methylated-DNA--[protein]-cysteine S-methyltransferase [Streptomyces sp. DH24]